MITLVVVTDGRDDCLARTIVSAEESLLGPITRKLIYDDTGDGEHREDLREQYGDLGYVVTHCPEGRQGFGGAIRFLWKYLSTLDDNPFVFHLEDDFIFRRDVPLGPMIDVLRGRPQLVQLVLRRQPWNDDERAAGGIVEQHPYDYNDCHDGINDWLEHRRFWSTNPHLMHTDITALGWPEDPHSEGKFTQRILGDGMPWRFGFWGARTSGEWVEHIGESRVGSGY